MFEDFDLLPVMTTEDIVKAQEMVKKMYCDEKIEKYIIRIIDATRHTNKFNIESGKYVEYGASPRSSKSKRRKTSSSTAFLSSL